MQNSCYDLEGGEIICPAVEEALYGQNAQHPRLSAPYTNNGDRTVSDNNMGILWQKTPVFDRKQYADALGYCNSLELGGHDDWRVPSLKELYSLADNRGELLTPEEGEPTPYIDISAFDFEYPKGLMFAGQYWSSTLYIKGPVMNGMNQGAFGFNFADGHIKPYGTGLDFYSGAEAVSSDLSNGPEDDKAPGNDVRCVSAEEGVYGVNDFHENGDGSVTDAATGPMHWRIARRSTLGLWWSWLCATAAIYRALCSRVWA